MNLFKALITGVQGVLEGQVLTVTTFRGKDGKKDTVKATVGIPALFINFDIFVPEKYVPDVLEGVQIQLLPELKIGKWNSPELGFKIAKVL